MRASTEAKWAVTFKEYLENSYPPYMVGPLVVISVSTVRKMAVDCPYHCIGSNSLLQQRSNYSCFWKFEDVFIGSCVAFADPDTLFDGEEKSMKERAWRKNHSLVIKKSADLGVKPVYLNDVKKQSDFYEASKLLHFIRYHFNQSIGLNKTQLDLFFSNANTSSSIQLFH